MFDIYDQSASILQNIIIEMCNSHITDNVETIIATSFGSDEFLTNVDANWDMRSNDSYMDTVFEFDNVLFDCNKLNQEKNDNRIEFDFNGIRMPNTTFDDNNCVLSNDTDDITTGNFSNGCIVMKDTLINFQTLKFNDNYDNVITSIKHNKDAYSEGVLSTNVDMVQVFLSDIFTTFIYPTNMKNDDEVYIENSTFASPNREYISYPSSKLDTVSISGDTIYITLYTNKYNKSAKMLTKSNKDYGDYIYCEYSTNDGNNSNLGLNLNISNNTFRSSVVNVILGSNNTASIGNNIYFDYNTFKNKSSNWGNEYFLE